MRHSGLGGQLTDRMAELRARGGHVHLFGEHVEAALLTLWRAEQEEQEAGEDRPAVATNADDTLNGKAECRGVDGGDVDVDGSGSGGDSKADDTVAPSAVTVTVSTPSVKPPMTTSTGDAIAIPAVIPAVTLRRGDMVYVVHTLSLIHI